MKKLILFSLLFSLTLVGCSYKTSDTKVEKKEYAEFKAGGQCTYATFEGECDITSIVDKSRDGNISYSVYFKYTPTKKLDLDKVGWSSEEMILEREHHVAGIYTGLECLERKYPVTEQMLADCGVKKGAVFNCELKLATSGTCSPMIFRLSEKIK